MEFKYSESGGTKKAVMQTAIIAKHKTIFFFIKFLTAFFLLTPWFFKISDILRIITAKCF